jgi:hypothetical protein
MTQEEFLIEMVKCLEAAGIPFMVAGSLSSSVYGQPRATRDVDLVIDPTAEQLNRFLTLLGSDYYVSSQAAHDALVRRSMFNVIHFADGHKADLIIRKDRPFSLEEFRRRHSGNILGHSLPIASPEDVILTKLEWNKITPSERQVQDALQVAVYQGGQLDQAYLRQWAPQLGVTAELEELLQAAGQTANKPDAPAREI